MAVPKSKVSRQSIQSEEGQAAQLHLEAGGSQSGRMPQMRCYAPASQNVPGVRYLQRPGDQGREVRRLEIRSTSVG